MIMDYCIEQPFHWIRDVEACYAGALLNDKAKGSYQIQIHNFIHIFIELNVSPVTTCVHAGWKYIVKCNMAQEDKQKGRFLYFVPK